jgi:UDP-glucose 4-epimerase
MHILLTGGLGFIGSHVAVLLGNDESYEITIIDNLSNSSFDVYDNILKLTKFPQHFRFVEGDVTNIDTLEKIFHAKQIDGIIHFASLKSVGESIQQPLNYYSQNLNGTINLLEMMEKYNCGKFIFSSSATVYGTQDPPLFETNQTGVGLTNPYGQTKYFQEQILQDFSLVYPEKEITLLRYFNPVGAHPSGLIGEDPNGIPNNLFPYILRVACRQYNELSIFGDDYDTPDGTCIRDFIHVMDLAEGHVAAIQYSKKGTNVYNLGTGQGVSVMELVKSFEKVNGISVPYKIAGRRPGDIVSVYSDATKAKEYLHWETKRSVEDICKDGYNFIMTKRCDRCDH